MNTSAPIILNISLLTIIGMIFISSIIYWYERDKRQRQAVEYWLSNGAYFLAATITNGMSEPIVAISTIFWLWRVIAVRNILEGVVEKELKRQWHLPLMIGSYVLSAVLNYWGYSFWAYTFPQALSIFIVALDYLREAKSELNRRTSVSITHYLLFMTIFIIFFHIADYPFFRFDAEFATTGFAISLMCNILMAILLPSVTIYELRMEHQRKLESKLQSQAKFSALGEMTAGIAHEINNPLGLITTRATYLRNHILRDSAEKDFIVRNLDQIEETTQRMATIINSLRNFSRDNRKEPWQSVAPGKIIEETMSYCRDRFRLNSIKVIIDPFPQVEIMCRPIQVSQVFLNLMNNSFDAILDTESPWVHISFDIQDTKVLIRVTDSGKGIPESVRKKIMEPFFTTKEMSGTGIGLSISRGIIEDHQGKLYYDESSINTAFVVELTLEQREA